MAADVEQMACRKGMMLLTCGPNGVRLVPPLIVTREQCQIALEILDEVIGEAEKKNKIG
jgi:4-aminobutyrate aminotransferase-like enzyme